MAFGKVSPKGTTTISAGWDAYNTFIDDLLAVTSGKGASQVGVEDSGANMAATNVEDALAEIYTDMGASSTLYNIFDEDPDTTTGTTWGYKAGIVTGGSSYTKTVAKGTVALTDDDVNYVEINAEGTVSKNTSAFSNGAFPLRQITVASGVQTVSTDKRTVAIAKVFASLAEMKTGTSIVSIVTPSTYGRAYNVVSTGTSEVFTAVDLYGNWVYTNEGASGEETKTLPASVVGMKATFIVAEDAQYLKCLANGTETMRYGATQYTGTGVYCRNNSIGTKWTLECVTAGEWIIDLHVGTLKINE